MSIDTCQMDAGGPVCEPSSPTFTVFTSAWHSRSAWADQVFKFKLLIRKGLPSQPGPELHPPVLMQHVISSRNGTMKKLILVGCVKTKRDARSAAKDLYNSPLWRSRRAYAERFGTDWYILSAKYGLVDPEETIAPYDLALTDLRAAERRTWAQEVLDDLAARVPDLRGSTVEIHAGKAYAEFGLENGLDDLGARVRRPLARIPGIGAHIAWYAEQLRRSDTQRLAELIAGDFYNGRFDLSARGMEPRKAWSLMPEVEATERIRTLGASEPAIRVFLTLVSAMDRARDAMRLWGAAAQLFESHPEVFDPATISSMSVPELRTLLSRSSVSQRHGPDSQAWHGIACSLASGVGAVARLVESGVGDAEELLEDLRRRDSRRRSRYPLLRGPKIRSMWMRIMANPGGANIRRIDTIPVAVDVHVRRATENLGVTATRDLRLVQAKPVIRDTWRNALQAARIGGPPGIADTCAALDPALWFFGKFGCSHCERIGRRAPIGRACANCQLDPS